MHALYRGLLVTALGFLACITVASLAISAEWTLQNRATILAASLGLGAAVALRTRLR